MALRAGASVPLGRRVEADAGLQAAPPEREQAKAQERLGSPEVVEAARCGGGGGGGGTEGELTEAAGGGGRTEGEDGGKCGRDTVRRSGRRLPGGDGRVRYALRDAAEGGAMAGRPGD